MKLQALFIQWQVWFVTKSVQLFDALRRRITDGRLHSWQKSHGAIVGGMLALLLAGCGQVITLTPTPTPAPTATLAVVMMAATPPPTPTPAPYTPLPTPTSTVTPTPVIHTVASGESLLNIATQHGVSVAALQEANGILDPRSLQVNQQLIIPIPVEQDAAAAQTPTATPLPVQVQNLYLSETAVGGLWVLGEVLNDSGTPLEQIRVNVALLDGADAVLAEESGMVALDLVDINERAPFAILFEAAPEQFDSYRVTPLSAVSAYVGSYYRDLEVRELESAGERYASYTVSGVIFNTGPEEAVDVQVVITAYDALDRVIAMRQVIPEYNVVPRGGQTTFTAMIAPVGGPVERVEAVAQGRRLQPSP
jgi:LysM repeat protein